MTAVVVEHLVKRYGEPAAVDGISFEVPDGQLLAVLGPNGAGKTTTLEILEGFLAPTAGTVRALGADPCHFAAAGYAGVLTAFALGAVAWAAPSTAIAGVIPKVEAAQPILLAAAVVMFRWEPHRPAQRRAARDAA